MSRRGKAKSHRARHSNDLVTVARFSETWKAHFARASLEAEGIRAYLADEQMTSLNWLYRYVIGGVKVQVAGEDAEKARQILAREAGEGRGAEQEESGASTETTRCPQCGSAELEREKPPRWVAIVSYLVLGIPFLVKTGRWVCQQCGHKWEEERIGLWTVDLGPGTFDFWRTLSHRLSKVKGLAKDI
jgi:DNA-directed RNA polymerase subunit RPC12/RpoP